MAINKTLYRLLRSGGVTGRAAALLSDDTSAYSLTPTAVTDAPALTSTAVAAADAVTPANAAYTQADQTALADLANETKADVNALRTDLEAVRTRLNALLAERR